MALALRPTFLLEFADTAEAIAYRLHERLAGPHLEIRWSRTPGASSESCRERTHVLVTLAEERRRFWSPWLHVDVRATEQGSEVFGRYSPHPNVWTAFALSYLLLGSIIFIGFLFASAQTMLHGHSYAWWPVAAASALAAVLWWSAQTGQRLARDQMEELDSRIRAALSSAVESDPILSPPLAAVGVRN